MKEEVSAKNQLAHKFARILADIPPENVQVVDERLGQEWIYDSSSPSPIGSNWTGRKITILIKEPGSILFKEA